MAFDESPFLSEYPAGDDPSVAVFLRALDGLLDPTPPSLDDRAEARKVLAIAAFATTYVATNDDVAEGFTAWLKDMGAPDALTSDAELVKSDLASAALTLTLT